MMVSPHVRNPMRSLAGILIVSLLAPLVPATGASAALPAYNPLTSATKIAVSKETLAPFKDTDFDKPKLSPKTNKHFDIVDPATKKPVDADTTITAPSGTKVRAGDYYKHINDLEDDLGTRGQSLRDGTSFELGTLKGGHQDDLKPTISRGPQTKGQYDLTSGSDRLHQTPNTSSLPKPISKPDDDDSSLDSAIAKINAELKANFKKMDIEAKDYGYKSLGLKPIAPSPPAPEPPPATKTNTYTESDGSKSLAAIALSASATSEAGKGHVGHVLGNASATAYFFGHSASIISATGDVTPQNETFDFSVLGDSFASSSGSVSTSQSPVVNQSKSISIFDFSIPISVSIFTVTLAASAAADFAATAFAYTGGSGPGISAAVMQFFPAANLVAKFSASFGFGDTSGSFGFGLAVGADGVLTIAAFTMPIFSLAQDLLVMRRTGKLKTDKNIYGCYLTFFYGNSGQLDYAFLSGSVSVFLKGCFIFCATVFNLHLFSWDGITGKDTMFKATGSMPGSVTYSDLADYGTSDPGTTFSKDDDSGMPQACDDLRKEQQQYGSKGS